MFTLAETAEHRVEIKKSRFTARAAPVVDVQAALAFIDAVRDVDATHNCWAYRLDPLYRFHDDGEPGGTAGRPIYAAIERQELDRIVVVVTRYFGGIKLGAGGLVRAYGGVAATCLRQTAKIALQAFTALIIECGFANAGRLLDELARPGVNNLRLRYTEQGLRVQLEVENTCRAELTARIRNVCRGAVAIITPED